MPFWPTKWLYRRFGRNYPSVIFGLQIFIALAATAGSLVLLGAYYDASAAERVQLLVIAEASVVIGLSSSFWKVQRRLGALRDWIGGRHDGTAAKAAWDAAVNLPIRVFRHEVVKPSLAVAVVNAIAAVVVLDLTWVTIFPLLAAALIAVGYIAILQYFAIETAMRPVILDINEHLSADFRFARLGLPLKVKLLTMLPMMNVITGLVVAAVTSGSGSSLGFAVLAATGVAFTLSLELSILLSNSVMRPVWQLREGLKSIGHGQYDVRVPVITGDELGELSDGFNQMAAGLAERERLREAFGTYLDKEVAEYILSSGFSERGVELEISVLFCDVRGFTRYAEGVEPTEVVSVLNRLFAALVPIIEEHGGHIDKFAGDGLMAVFGAPEPFEDHPDRALAAGCEIVRVVASGVAGELRMGVGINTGKVVAGSIGGGGRLNFSVIGDTVNVAARVEAATRETGDDLLFTAATRERLSRPVECVSRGEITLRGRDEPIEVCAPAEPASDAPAGRRLQQARG
jgi:adenylate cyclase